MGSLFDIAGGLSQYGEVHFSKPIQIQKDPHQNRAKIAFDAYQTNGISNNQIDGSNKAAPVSTLPALFILDDTLQQIYDTRRISPKNQGPAISTTVDKQQTPALLPPIATPKVKPSIISDRYPSLESLNDRLEKLLTTRNKSQASNILASRPKKDIIEDINEAPTSSSIDPDMVAKRVIREVTEEIEQIPPCNGDQQKIDRLERYLIEKYVDTELKKLPSTPFVQLARKKVLHKIQQFKASREITSVDKQHTIVLRARPSTSSSKSEKTPEAAKSDLVIPTLTTEQLQAMKKLLALSESQQNALPKAQKELLQFAKRYEKIINVSKEEIHRLPSQQREILLKMQGEIQKEKKEM